MDDSMSVVGRYQLPLPPKRVCAASGCGTVLSRYNHDTRCAVHQDRERPSIAANAARLPAGRRLP